MAAERQVAIRLTLLDGGRIRAELREIGETGDRALGDIVGASRPASSALSALSSTVAGVTAVIDGGFAVGRLVEFGRAAIETERQFEALDRRILDHTGSQALLAETMDYINEAADRQNAALLTVTEGYTGLLPLVRSGILTTSQARQIFEGYNDIVAATGASNEQLKRSLFGVSQGLSTQTLRAEELNQTTEAIPGLLQAMDRAAGGAAGSFRQLVVQGKVTSEMFRDVLIKALLDYKGAAERTADDLGAKFNELETAWTRFKRMVGDGMDPGVKNVADTLTRGLNWAVRQGGPKPAEVVQKELDEARAVLKSAQAGEASWRWGIKPGRDDVDMWRNTVAKLEGELNARADRAAEAANRDIVEAIGQVNRTDELARQRLDGIRREIRGTTADLATTPAEKLAAIDAKLLETKARILDTAKAGNVAQGDVDAAIAEAEAMAERQRARVRAPDEQRGQQDEQRRQQALQRIDETTDALGREADAIGKGERERTIAMAVQREEQALRRAGVDLTSEEARTRLEGLRTATAAVYDARAAERDRQRAEDEARAASERSTQARRDALATLDAQISGLSDERAALGRTARERAIHTAALRAETEARRAGLRLDDPAVQARVERVREEAAATYDANVTTAERNRLMDEGRQLTESLMTPTERYADTIADLDVLLMTGAITWETYGRAVDEARGRMEGAASEGKGMMEELQASVEGFGRRSARALADWATGAETSFKRVGEAFVSEILEKMIYKNVTGPLADLGSSLLGSAAGWATSLLGFASGGPVAAGVPITVGELGREVFVPDQPGRIVPNHRLAELGGGAGAAASPGVTVVQNVTIDARGADAGSEARIRLAMAQTKEETIAELWSQIGRGGPAARMVGRR